MKKHLLLAAAGMTIASAAWSAWSSPAADDLIRMARSGVDEEVLSAYVASSPDTYDLSAEDIITLKDLGVSSKIITSAIHHGRSIDTETRSSPAGQPSAIPADTLKNPLQPEQLVSTSAAEVRARSTSPGASIIPSRLINVTSTSLRINFSFCQSLPVTTRQ